MSNNQSMVVVLRNALDELVSRQAVVENSVGIGSNGKYEPIIGANYIANISSIGEEIKEIDTQLFNVATTFASLEYVQEKISTTIANAPSTLDTLNEIAAALGNDENLFRTLSTQLNVEKVTARAAESTIQGNLENEALRALTAEQLLSTNLQSQSISAQQNESTITVNIAAEEERSITQISTLTSILNSEASIFSTTIMSTAASLIKQIGEDLSGNISTIVNSEVVRAKAAEYIISSAVYNETQRAVSAENFLQSTITSEQLRAMTIEQSISSSIVSETTRATQAESTITGRISTIERTYVQKDGSVSFTGNVNLNSNVIKNLSTGITLTSLTTKKYVDTKISSLGSVFEYVGTLDASQVTNLDTQLPKTAETGDSYKVTVGGTLSYNSGTSSLTVSVRDLILKNGQGGWDKVTDKEMTLAPGSSGSNITVTGTTDLGYTVDIAAGYIGQPSITTLGTVTTGRWNASTLATTKSGSGQSSYTQGDLLIGSSNNSLNKLAIGTSNTFLGVNGGSIAYRGAESANIALTSVTNFTNLSTTQQALDKLYDETQKRSFAQIYQGYTGDYSDSSTVNSNLLSGKINFIKPTTFTEARFEDGPVTASSGNTPNFAFDSLSTTSWTGGTVGSNTYVAATGVYQGSTITTSLPIVQFTKQLPTFNTTAADTTNIRNVAADTDGNIYICYQTTSNVSGKTRTGTTDIVVFKLNSTGTLQWVKQESTFNTTGANTNPRIHSDSTGIIVVFETTGTLPGKTKTSSAGNKDIALFKLNFDGTLAWTVQSNTYNCTTNNQSVVVDKDPSGNIYMVYLVSSAVPGGTHRAGLDIAVAKFNGLGALSWVKQQTDWNTMNNEAANAGFNMMVDPSGNVYCAYTVEGATIPSAVQPWQGRTDGVWFKLNTNGVFQWARQEGNVSDWDFPTIIAASVDDIFILNYTMKRISPTTGAITNSNVGGLGSFPRSSNNRGSWHRDLSNNLYYTFDSEGGIGGGYSFGGTDVHVYKYDWSNWSRRWESYGGTAYATVSNEINASATVDSFGNVILTYMTLGTVAGGTAKGDYDVVVTKLSQGDSMVAAGTNIRGEWIQISNNTSYAISKYNFRSALTKETTFAPTSFSLFGSSNGSNWTILDSQSNLTFSTNEVKTFTISSSNSYSTYRFVTTGVGSSAGNGSRSNVQIGEINMYALLSAGQSTYRHIGPSDFTTANVKANWENNTQQNLFDHNSNTHWETGGPYNATSGVYTGTVFTTSGGSNYYGDWATMRTPVATSLKQYRIRGRVGFELTVAPSAWRIFGSTDNSTWTLLDSKSNIAFTTNEVKTFTLAADTLPYTYFRFVTQASGSSGTRGNANTAELTYYASVSGGASAGGGNGSGYTIYLPPTNAGLANGTIIRLVHNGQTSDGDYIVSYKNAVTSSNVQLSELYPSESMSFVWNNASSSYLNAVGI